MTDTALYSGKLDAFAGSMAEEIENAYNQVLGEAGKDKLGDSGQQDRRILFIAIARGVINHLVKHQGAITVRLPASPANQTVTAIVEGS